MTHLIRNAFLAVLTVGLAGCEWSGGGDDNSWNDSGTIANFNGNYHASGGYLVSDYTTTSGGTTTTTTGGFIPPIEEISSSYSGNSISFTTGFVPIRPGSVTVAFADGAKGSVTDNGSGGLTGTYLNTIPGEHAANGSVVYENGQVSIFFPDVLGLQSSRVTIRYTVDSGTSSSTTTTGSSSAGSSGVTIYSFNVQQTGNKIKLIDNNGSIYEGTLGDMRTTGNVGSGSTGATFSNGDQLIATFSAGGKSASGMYVNMAGNFQGTVQGVTSTTSQSGGSTTTKTSMSLADRRIMGTWIEDGGKTGNISGVSDSAVNVSTSSSSSTNTTGSLL